LQEAPALRNIIEPCPIRSFGINLNTENTSSNVVGQKADEMLMFTIRFEQLIPRLQRYFDLDSMRRSLLDFEPSVDSRRLLNLISLQASKADSPEATKEVLEAITSVPWHGFKEKDSALQLILTVYNNLTASLSGKNSLAESEDPKDRAVHAKLLDAVRTVGYPSQILHDAQVHKIALRDVGSLVAVAGNSKHSRFHEAWLLMATSDYGRHTADQRLQLINFLTSIHTLPNLKNERLVQIKAIDAICSLGHTSGPEELASLTQCLDNLGLWFADKGADAEVLSLYVDAYLFLSQHHDTAVAMGQRTSEAFKKVLSGLEDVMGSDHPKLVALLSRWQELIELKKSLSAKIA
jgi:hypothetical protein